MKFFLFSLIIISSHIILSFEKDNENISFNQTIKQHHKNNTKKFKQNNPYYIPNTKIYSLNDLNFDTILQNGNYYKWLVILYSETCGHCEHARKEIRKIFHKYKNSTTIRFAEIEININHMTDIRFDYVDGVPYIFLLQNNSLYEMDLYPSEKNLIKFLETDFKDVKHELKSFPSKVGLIQIGWFMFKSAFRGVTEGINELLYIYGFEFQFTPLLFVLMIIMIILLIFILDYFCCSKCCPDEKIKKELIKKINEINEEQNKKNNKKENEKNKELNEEEKIEREKEKEKEKEKNKNEENKQNIEEKNKGKKKKKE